MSEEKKIEVVFFFRNRNEKKLPKKKTIGKTKSREKKRGKKRGEENATVMKFRLGQAGVFRLASPRVAALLRSRSCFVHLFQLKKNKTHFCSLSSSSWVQFPLTDETGSRFLRRCGLGESWEVPGEEEKRRFEEARIVRGGSSPPSSFETDDDAGRPPTPPSLPPPSPPPPRPPPPPPLGMPPLPFALPPISSSCALFSFIDSESNQKERKRGKGAPGVQRKKE